MSFINNVIDIYLEACAGNTTHGQLRDDLIRLEKEAKTLGPAAISAVAEMEMRLQNNAIPSITNFMRNLQTARIGGRMLANRL